jgi:hypothetical protein
MHGIADSEHEVVRGIGAQDFQAPFLVEDEEVGSRNGGSGSGIVGWPLNFIYSNGSGCWGLAVEMIRKNTEILF